MYVDSNCRRSKERAYLRVETSFLRRIVTSVFAQNVISSVSLRLEYETKCTFNYAEDFRNLSFFYIIYYFCSKYRLWTCYPEENIICATVSNIEY